MSASVQDQDFATVSSTDQGAISTAPNSAGAAQWGLIVAGGIAALLLLVRSLM